MDRPIVSSCSRSAHHGYINYENQLVPTFGMFKRYPDIDIVEIDFVYHNGKFISSHDYSEDNIKVGSTLEEWCEYIVSNNKILWIDIKDSFWSILSERFSSFDVNEFYRCLNTIQNSIPNIKNYILVSCQYVATYQKLVQLNNGNGYKIIHDMPQDMAYILIEVLPLYVIKSYVHNQILESLQGTSPLDIVCLDRIFFEDNNEMNLFISKLPHKIFVVYSYNRSDVNLPKVADKQIIIQFDYQLR